MRVRLNSITICTVLLILLLLTGCVIPVYNDIPSDSPPPETTAAVTAVISAVSPTPSPVTFSMAVIGDVMCHSYQYLDAYNKDAGIYDFSHNYTYIREYLSEPDITVGNLETSFGGTKLSGYPQFNSPPELVQNLADAGVDVLNTANNHCLDNGFKGLLKTMEILDKAGIDYTGTYATKEERDKQSGVLIKYVKGVKIAFLSYTYGTNAIPLPKGKEYAVNIIFEDYLTNLSVIREDAIIKDIEAAKKMDPDLICAFMHWGNEYQLKQDPVQEKLANLLFENGVDVILGGHSHVLQPLEERVITTEGGEEKKVFVCYSLGNFISAQYFDNTYFSAILNLNFSMDSETRKVTLNNVGYVPIYTYSNRVDDSDRFYVLNLHKALSEYEFGGSESFSEETYFRMLNALKTTHAVLGKEYDSEA